jgi:uncharacterized protein YutD
LLNFTNETDDFFSRLPNTYEYILKNNGLKRIRTSIFTHANNLVNQKKFEKKVVKFEEFIDEMLAYELFNFKMLMQTEPGFSNYGEEFLRCKSLLVLLTLLLDAVRKLLINFLNLG